MMNIKKDFARVGNLLFYGDKDNNSFAVFQETKGLPGIKHLLSVIKNADGRTLNRENGAIGFSDKQMSAEGRKLMKMACEVLNIS